MALNPFAGVRRTVATVGLSAAMIAGGLVAPAFAEVTAPTKLLPTAACTSGATQLEIYTFNDFHGRIQEAAKLFTPVEQARAAGKNVLLLSNGDNIGGSTFESASQNDDPTIKILNAAKVDASSAGNHEFDKGLQDLVDRYADAARTPDFPILAANVVKSDGTVPAPLKAYEIKEVAGVKVGIVGAVTSDLPALVSPVGIAGLTVGDPVQAVNKVATELKDGNDANGEADIVIALIHEGAAVGGTTADPTAGDPAANAATSPAFKSIYESVDPKVNVVINGHTHQLYSWQTTSGQPLLQAQSYGAWYGKVVINVEAGAECGTTTATALPVPAADLADPEIKAIADLSAAAVAESDVIGAKVVAQADGTISLPAGLMKPDVRDKESPATNLVAKFFGEVLDGNANYDGKKVIGIQNPGGTRAGFDNGDITYKEAALMLPFANTIKTTEITGAQFKKVLEQQWQRTASGTVPSRAYLRLGLSPNVTYTYDENLPEGSRITNIYYDGAPMSMTDTFTAVSGNFLIEGGDNFHELAKGANTRDTGLVDLTAFTEWVSAQGTIQADYRQGGVSLKGNPSVAVEGSKYTLAVGVPLTGGVATDTLNSTGAEATPNTTLNAFVVQGTTKVKVGTAPIVDGKVGEIAFRIPVGSGLAKGAATLQLEAEPTKTLAQVPLTLVVAGKNFAWGDQTGDRIGDIIAVDGHGVLNLYQGKVGGLTGLSTKAGGGWDAFTWISHTPDVNGDGKDDLLGLRNDGAMFLYLGLGMGQYTSARLVGTGFDGMKKLVVVGDMNNDKLPELVAIGADNGLYRYSIANGGTLRDARQIGKNWGAITNLASVGDFNNDGSADILATNATGDLFVYYSSPTGTIIQAAHIGRGWTGFTAMFGPGDLTGDGRVDLVGRNADGKLFLYANNNGKWGVAKQIGNGWGSFTLFG
ncbi:5'-nucleotidase C-terminal domain-containing protein [Propionibacteriaceae bacterium G57]|uniref:5'-nucleotidase C-terminal domain-containing protein n=1 Tax=Aestuariimicrobium sp. G57 TaxID=3418485 RepID=UPI003DA6E3C4